MSIIPQAKKLIRMKPYRRAVQLLVLIMLILIPFAAQNPADWAPSRIVQGLVPAPSVFNILGDTWSFEISGFRLAHPMAFLDTWISAKVIYLPLVMAVLVPLGLTLLLGRVFCSWICPIGFLLELNMKAAKYLTKIGVGKNFPLKDFRFVILFSCLFLAFIISVPILSIVDPPHMLGREFMNIFTHHTVSFAGGTVLLGILFMDSFISSRACCGKLCPSGGGLSLLAKYRVLRIHVDKGKCIECGICNESCPYQLEPMGLAQAQDFNWTTCDNCGLCRDSCPEEAITYVYSVPTSKKQ